MDQYTTATSTSDDTAPLTQIEIDQRIFDLYDEYCHGTMDRRDFLRAPPPSRPAGWPWRRRCCRATPRPDRLLHRHADPRALRQL